MAYFSARVPEVVERDGGKLRRRKQRFEVTTREVRRGRGGADTVAELGLPNGGPGVALHWREADAEVASEPGLGATPARRMEVSSGIGLHRVGFSVHDRMWVNSLDQCERVP